MGGFIGACPTVPTIKNSEVRFSVDTKKIRRIFDWPVAYVSCGEIAPDQPRLQWGVPTHGARYDSFSGFRLGNENTNLTLGSRTAYVSGGSAIGEAERQQVGVATLTLGGRVRFKYWNDHRFWWWPIGDGGDRGDTAGLQFSYNLTPHHLRTGDWLMDNLSLTMRLATGIPNRASARPMGDGQVYTEVKFPSIDRGDLNLNASLENSRRMKLDIGLTVNSGLLRHRVQSDGVHKTLQIPEFPLTTHFGAMIYVRLRRF